MFKIVMIVLCVLMLLGMIALDFFISRGQDRPDRKDDEHETKENDMS